MNRSWTQEQAYHRGFAKPAIACLGLVFVTTLLLSGCSSQRFESPSQGTVQRGIASWYGEPFHGRLTANGEVYDMYGLSAAHKELPLGTMIEVHNLDTGRRMNLRINDRGPYIRGRILDLSYGAAKQLGVIGPGLAKVEIRVLEVGQGRYGAGPNSRFTVQLGAFGSLENAEAMMQRVAARHEGGVIVSEGGIHRVRVGKFRSHNAAKELRRQLKSEGFDALVIVLP